MFMRLQGKTCVITAAGQGIGAATARAFAKEGATVWATDVDEDKLTALSGVDGVRPRRLDVLDKAAIGALAKETSAVDVLFNCAGFVHHGAVLDATDDQWAFAFDLNVRSMLWTIQAFLPGMLEKGGGSIVNMSSAASSVKGAALRCIYGTTKAAVIGLTKSVAVDYVARGVRCNAICPGTVQTPSLDERIASLGGGPDARKFFMQRQPAGRFGSADEIAALAVYLASDESAFTTGTINVIDGGWSV
jgi:NAD(P)-dependent dehydrogenase (short-subunit alcohol dehydrogenase family)